MCAESDPLDHRSARYLPVVIHKGLDTGFKLDQLWHALRGDMERSKRPALASLAKILVDAGTPYAVIGGVALQIHQEDPRTTLVIDLAVKRIDDLPRDRLTAGGFAFVGRFEHSENWKSADGIPIQFTDDPALHVALGRPIAVELDGVTIRVLAKPDLLREKLRAGSDPARRRSKRMQDLADVQALIEAEPTLADALTPEQRAMLDRLV